MRAWLALSLLCLVLAGCQSAARLQPLEDGPYAPGSSGVEVDDPSAPDGLIVGHRLMAAGEYELALKAYFRAGAQQGLTVDVLSALGSANLKLGRLNQAEDLLRRAIAKDEKFVPAWNNLGVTLMEMGNSGEAMRVFRTAFALDGAATPQIRDNLRLALAKMENPAYTSPENHNFDLVRRGASAYLLLEAP